jgi:DNA polymerase III delta subunit
VATRSSGGSAGRASGSSGARPLGYRDVRAALARDPLPRVWVLLGEERELKSWTTEALGRELARRSPQSPPERHVADCDDRSLADLASTYLVGSLFATTKLVVLTRFDKAPIADRRALLSELSAGQLHPCLTVVIQSAERSLPAQVDPAGLTTFVFWPLNQESEIQSYVRDVLARLGCTGSPDLAAHVQARYGHDLGLIRSELEKARLMVAGASAPILTPAIFDSVASPPPGDELFGVLDQLVSGQGRRAVAGLAALWKQGEPPQKVLPILLGQYRRLLHAAVLKDADPDRFAEVLGLAERHRRTANFWQRMNLAREVAGALKRAVSGTAFEDELSELKPMPAMSLARQLAAVPAATACRTFRELLRLDFRMKTSSVDPEIALEVVAARSIPLDSPDPAVARSPRPRSGGARRPAA